jgi:putative transposase
MKRYDPRLHGRRSIRLPAYDYRTSGAYFLTICTFRQECLFTDEPLAQIVRWTWKNVTRSRRLRGDAFVVMPNHVHGILWITDGEALRAQHSPSRINIEGRIAGSGPSGVRNAPCAAPLHRPRVDAGSLSAAVRAFKSASTRRINEARGLPGIRLWQRNYYERVIRNPRELEAARRYVLENPQKWAEDPNNPANEAAS